MLDCLFGALCGYALAIDGDTLWMRAHKTKVRLANVDTPEIDTDAGKRAHMALAIVVSGKKLTCTIKGLDRYGRTLALCTTPEGNDLGEMLIEHGLGRRWVTR